MRQLAALLLAMVPAAAYGQSTPSEAQSLQSLVNEVRELRQELRSVTVASQRVQIVLYRLQAQEVAVSRASERVANERAHLASIQAQVRDFATQIQLAEEKVNRSQEANERKQLEDGLPQARARLEGLRKDEQTSQAALSEGEGQLRREQQDLASLQSFLDRLDNVLNDLGAATPKR